MLSSPSTEKWAVAALGSDTLGESEGRKVLGSPSLPVLAGSIPREV